MAEDAHLDELAPLLDKGPLHDPLLDLLDHARVQRRRLHAHARLEARRLARLGLGGLRVERVGGRRWGGAHNLEKDLGALGLHEPAQDADNLAAQVDRGRV